MPEMEKHAGEKGTTEGKRKATTLKGE